MVVNTKPTEKSTENRHVEFISYTDKYPSLCFGVLTLKIDGEVCCFGLPHKSDEPIYPRFWESGGDCGFLNNYETSYVHSGEWLINEDELPKKYQKYAREIDEVFNANVSYGCCGGCL